MKNSASRCLLVLLKSADDPEAVYTAEMGKHKVPTLRNVDLRFVPGAVRAYGHNG